jgi:hypothetical protein
MKVRVIKGENGLQTVIVVKTRPRELRGRSFMNVTMAVIPSLVEAQVRKMRPWLQETGLGSSTEPA